ncbi:MAG TPA: DUF58 domain-containing protein [Anaerolineae bacterium]
MQIEPILRSLNGLHFVPLQRRPGVTTGERRSPRRGRSVEFADYRDYTPGDDPRRVDWNVYARLERPYVKLYEDEEDLTVHILLDASPSMQWREENLPASPKWERAAQLAIAMGYIALASGDRLVIETSSRARYGPKRGVAATSGAMEFIEREMLPAEVADGRIPPNHLTQATNLSAWWKRYALDARPGLCIIISDFFDPEGYVDGLNSLGSGQLDICALHTLSPAELDPDFAGDLRLRDIEVGATQDISLDDAALNQYKHRLAQWTSEIAENCRRRGGKYHLTDTGETVEKIVLRDLRREGWIM